MAAFAKDFDILRECRDAGMRPWSCPPVLFIVMGGINIVAMLAAYLLASRYVEEPELAALIVISVAALIFVLGHFIIHGFRQIAEANRIKTEFIAIVSHQLRSPLSVFKWTLDAIAREQRAATPSSEMQSYRGILAENTEKMIQLVNMLLDVSRIEAGRFSVKREPVSLSALTAELLRSFEPYAAANHIMLASRSTGEAIPAVVGDREKLKMVVQNLVDNAIRYSTPGGTVTIRLLPGGAGSVEWQVGDQGIGIPPEERNLIFQKFYRTTLARRHQTDGMGIGLYIARAVVEALGGEIGFRSEVGKGSTFWFRLPVYSS